MRKLTLKGGPLDGKTYHVPAEQDTLAADGGHYKLTARTAKWQPDKPEATD
ncbi:hypothetical protein [Microbacterium sp. PA5]|uniref:hypothetical protein n=1 Tax=Microbacterium sp. PA5 TaxID=3416654 RepID=UPI003CFA05DB